MNIDTLQGLLRRKWVLAGGGVLLVVLFVVAVLSSAPKPEITPEPVPDIQYAEPQGTSVNTQPVLSPFVSEELQKAIEKQKNVDLEYSQWQVNVRKQNPLKGLPLTSERYFVYFDINKDVFIGRLYPKKNDAVDQLKQEIVSKLKEINGASVEKYLFEWVVFPQ